MPTEQISNAPEDLTPKDGDTAAAVLSDERLHTPAGGGGLGGQSAAEGDPQRNRPAGDAEPALPLDTGVDGTNAPNRAQDEAKLQATAAEPHPRSQ